MNKREFKTAFVIAKSPEFRKQNTSGDLSIFDGFGLHDFQSVYVTHKAVASLINWQALQFNGEYDTKALSDIAFCGRKKFQIIDSTEAMLDKLGESK